MIYKSVPESYKETYDSYFDLNQLKLKYRQNSNKYKMLYSRAHPVSFAYFMLGKTVRMYQSYAIDMILNNPEVALDWARRLGKSFIFTVLSFWLTYFNKEPKNSIEKFTEIGLISKEDRASKKLLTSTRHLITEGDDHVFHVTKVKGFFSNHLIEPNNTEQITWDNGSKIISLPPTKKVRGFGFSRVFIDELAHLIPRDDPDTQTFYIAAVSPTLADTNGSICISSTPNGPEGIYYDLFDPEGDKDSSFVGIWFEWLVNKDNPNYCLYVETQKQKLLKQGRYNMFRQEFLGEFTVTQNSFYDLDDVNKYFDVKQPSYYEWHKSPCSLGLDYGVSKCPCVATIKTKYRGQLLTLYQRVYPIGYDTNELINGSNDDSIQGFCRRYDIAWIVPDECPSGDMINRWMMREGYPVQPYSFQGVGDKNRAYYKHRALLKTGTMKCYPLELLRHEMQTLQEEQLKKFVSIGKGGSGSDDCIDSDVYSTIPFFDDDTSCFGVSSIEVTDGEVEPRGVNNRLVDAQWEGLKGKGIDDMKEYNRLKIREGG